MTKKSWWHGSRGEWYVVIQFILFALIGLGPKEVSWLPLLPASSATELLFFGVIIAGMGGILAAMGLFNLGSNLSPYPHPLEEARFVEAGAYKVVRHPIYSGLILGGLGLGLMQRSPLVMIYAGILFLFFDVKTRREEHYLSQKFSQYNDYKKRVSKLLPYIY